MTEIDVFSRALLEQAKRFLEKAEEVTAEEERAAYLHAALMLAFGALEAHVNSIADDFLVRPELNVLERSILSEREYKLRRGKFELTDNLKMYRLEDRIEFIHHTFSSNELDKGSAWWSKLKEGMDLRNRITHPKEHIEITVENVRNAIQAIIDSLDALYMAVYRKGYPPARRSLKSTLSF
jgi:hypothetical protein